MTITNFLAVMKMTNWIEEETYQGIKLQSPNKEVCIRVIGRPILIQQHIYRSGFKSHYSTLCECKNFEDTIEYISNLNMNNLPPNGKIK